MLRKAITNIPNVTITTTFTFFQMKQQLLQLDICTVPTHTHAYLYAKMSFGCACESFGKGMMGPEDLMQEQLCACVCGCFSIERQVEKCCWGEEVWNDEVEMTFEQA